MNSLARGTVILFSLLIGMILTVGHLPAVLSGWIGWLRPEWMVLVCFFWAVEVPERVGLVSVWLCGLALDVLVGDAIGTNGTCLAAVSYIGWKLHARARLYSPFQQVALVFAISLAVLWLNSFIDRLVNGVAFTPYMIVSAVCTSLCWIPLSLVLGRVKTRFDIR